MRFMSISPTLETVVLWREAWPHVANLNENNMTEKLEEDPPLSIQAEEGRED